MKISELLKIESILLNAKPKTKKEAIEMALEISANHGNIKDPEAFRKAVFAREREGTTGVGEGIAIPHGKGRCVEFPSLTALVIPNGVEFHSMDRSAVTLMFLIAAPDTKDNVHLSILAKLCEYLVDGEFTSALRATKTSEEFLAIVKEFESRMN